jgi:transposase
MTMLADSVEVVIGVDTHKQTHTAAGVATATGHTTVTMTVPASAAGYQRLLELADQHNRRRVWAIEGTGGYGAGLTRFLTTRHEQVVELDRPKRAARRHGAKSDPIDATRAAREALGRDQLAQPRAAGPRAALSVRLAARRSAVQAAGDAQRQLPTLVIAAPEGLRNGFGSARPASWWQPAPGSASAPIGMWRPRALRPRCGHSPVGSRT